MNGRRIVKRTTKALIRTIIWVSIFIGVGFGTYKLTLTHYISTGQYAASASDDSKAVVKATTDSVAVNAIFVVDGDDGVVKHQLLEIFHSKTGKLDFVSIPVDSYCGMSKELFATITKTNPNVPQIMSWKDLPRYFNQVTAYQYGCLMLEESMGIHISFYTLMSETTFEKYFEEIETSSFNSTNTTKGYTLNEKTCNKIKKLNSSLQMERELASYYTEIQSNLSLTRRNTYLPAYQKADYDNIGVYALSKATDMNQIAEEEVTYLKKLIEE